MAVITELGRWGNSTLDERGRRIFSNGLDERGRRVFGLVAPPAGNALFVQLNDNLTVSDNQVTASVTSGVVHHTIQLNDTLSVTDSPFTQKRTGHVTLTENLNLSDSASSVDTAGTTHRTSSLNDNLTLTDSITSKRTGHVSLSDSMTLSDSRSTNLIAGATNPKIQFKRGNQANLPTLQPGEPAVTLDTQSFFVGTNNGNIQMSRIIIATGGTGLPIASSTYQWVIGVVPGGSGAADGIYICKKQANGTYAWVQFA